MGGGRQVVTDGAFELVLHHSLEVFGAFADARLQLRWSGRPRSLTPAVTYARLGDEELSPVRPVGSSSWRWW